MSIKVMSAVWDVALSATDKLVLLALADCANDEGHCWPSATTIARKCGQGERTVRRAVQSLIVKGHLSQKQRSGTSAVYTVHPCQSGTPARAAPLPDRPDTPARAAPKPSGTVKLPKKDKPSLDARGTKLPFGFTPILTAEPMKLVAGWPPGRFEGVLAQFCDHHTAKGTISKDWQASFRTWIRNEEKWNPQHGRRRSGAQPEHPYGRTVDAAEELIAELATARADRNARADHHRAN